MDAKEFVGIIYSVFYILFAGIGFGFVILPTLVCVNRYFKKNRSLAIGLAVCGTGIGIFAFAQLVRFLINKYGWRGTTFIEAGISFNIAVFGAFLRPVIYSHEDDNSGVKKNENWPPGSGRDINQTACTHSSNFFSRHFEFSLFKDPVFLIFTVSNILTALGYGTPYTFLPDRAEEKGITKFDSAFLISTMGITNLFGRLLFGWLADQRYVNRLFLYGVSVLICGIVNILNPLNDSNAYLLVYAAIQGMFSGVFISLNTVVLADFIGLDRLDKGLGLLQAIKGIGYYIGPPITGWLYDGTGSYDASFYFVGCCMSLGGIVSILIPVQQKISIKSHQAQLDNNINLETNQTKF